MHRLRCRWMDLSCYRVELVVISGDKDEITRACLSLGMWLRLREAPVIKAIPIYTLS